MHSPISIIGFVLPFIVGCTAKVPIKKTGCFPMADPSRNIARLSWSDIGDQIAGDAGISHICQQVSADTTWNIGTGSVVSRFRKGASHRKTLAYIDAL